MLHTNYIGSFHYIAKGIGQLKIEVPSEEREMVDKFEHSYSKYLRNIEILFLLNSLCRFLDYDDMDMIKLVHFPFRFHPKFSLQISKFLSFSCTKAASQRFTEFYVPDNTT